MLSVRSRINYLNIVLVLFSLINFFELFLPRDESQQSSARLPIQILNIVVLLLMIYFIAFCKLHFNRITKVVLSLVGMIIAYFFVYLIDNNIVVGEIRNYIKFTTWLIAIIFFFEALLRFPTQPVYFQIYAFTFVCAIAKKIFDASVFDNEKLNGGDTASLPLLFIIPTILLLFKSKYRFILLSACAFLILISLRRTSILSLAVCMPFIYKYLKSSLTKGQVLLIVVLFFCGLVAVWMYFGVAIQYRFSEFFDKNSEAGVGSGRSSFYLIVWDNYLSGNYSIFLGNGLTSVKYLLMKKANFELTHAHNDFLEIIYTFGLLGICLWLFFLKAIWNLKNIIKNININIFFVTFISFMIVSISSGSILRIEMISFSINLALLQYYTVRDNLKIVSVERT